MRLFAPVAAVLLMAAPAFAESHASGDAASGEDAFNRQCVTCHVVVNDEGETLAGKRAKTGPNLYGVAGRAFGAAEDYRYSKSMTAAGEAGNVWTEETFVPYVQDPTGVLREVLDDKSARGKMTFKVREEADAVNIWAFLVSVGPEVAMDAMEENEAMEETEAMEEAPASN